MLDAAAPVPEPVLLATAPEPDEAPLAVAVAAVELGWFGLGATLAAAAYRSCDAYVTQLEDAGTRAVYGIVWMAPADSGGCVYVVTAGGQRGDTRGGGRRDAPLPSEPV